MVDKELQELFAARDKYGRVMARKLYRWYLETGTPRVDAKKALFQRMEES